MRYKLFIATALGMVVATTAFGGEFKRLKTKSEYLTTVADRKLVAEWGWVIAASDGTMMGQINGQPAQGKWNWQGGYWCRTISYGSNDLPRNCQTVHVSGDTVVSIRDKGKGKQTAMKIK